jgi:hypothetical protein
LCASIGNTGDFRICAADDVSAYPKSATIDLCGAIPTTSGNVGGGPLIRGLTHRNADTSTNFPANTSTGNNSTTNDNFGVSRGFINYDGGTLKLVGQSGPLARRLNAAASIGATTLTLDSAVTAKAGAKVLITPDGFWNAAKRTEVRTLAADVTNSATITITAGLGFARWGQLQYATDAGISLTAGTFSTMRTHAEQDPTIDQRAFVCIVDRSIKVQGYDSGNTSLAGSGFGFHGMTMGLTSVTVLKNVQFNKYGQLGLLGRYGWHFHIPSYNPATGAATTTGVTRAGVGNALVSGANSYPDGNALLDSCTFVDGFNRAFTFHACVGVTVQDCIAYDSAGHSFFEEDGTEEGNTSLRNIAIAPRDPGSMALKLHENTPAGHWIANFNNTHQDCWTIDSPAFGWWNAPSRGLIGFNNQFGCLGFSSLVPIVPFYGKMGTWDGMSALCCSLEGGLTNNFPLDNGGNVGQGKIQTTTDGIAGADYGNPNQTFTWLRNARLYKTGGYSNRISIPKYQNWRTADNWQAHLHGQTDQGTVEHIMPIRETLNHEGHTLSTVNVNAFASYHGLLTFIDVCAYEFSGGTPAAGADFGLLRKNAVIETWDLYTAPVMLWSQPMTGWKLYNSVGLWQTPGPSTYNDYTLWDTYYGGHRSENQGANPTNEGGRLHWILAGAIFDRYGSLSTGPGVAGIANSYIIPNLNFCTYNLTTTAMPESAESKVTTTPFFGIQPYADDKYYPDGSREANGMTAAIKFQRCDTSGVPISGALWAMRPSYAVDDVDVDTGYTYSTPNGDATKLDRMGQFFNGEHHGVCPKGGIIKYTRPDQAAANTTSCRLHVTYGPPSTNPNASAADAFIIGVPWSHTVSPQIRTDGGTATSMSDWTSSANMAALIATTKLHYWNDTANDTLWLKIGRPSGTLYASQETFDDSWWRVVVTN